jgi:hypothetical protein
MVQVYRDSAISGATAVRPGYQAMLEGAREAAFDIVVAEALASLISRALFLFSGTRRSPRAGRA